jgi:RNA recognition motif-containing protein
MQVRLYVGNLPFKVTTEELNDLFGQFGQVVDAHLVNDRESGRPRGFGFVTLGSKEEAEKAIQELHGKDFQGRALVVNEARPREDRPGGGGGFGSRPPRDDSRRPRY